MGFPSASFNGLLSGLPEEITSWPLLSGAFCCCRETNTCRALCKRRVIRQKGGACHGAHRPAGRSYEEWGTAVDAGITSEGQGGPP